MNSYLVLPLTACVASAVLALAILLRDPSHRAHRVGAALISGASLWAFFEVLWNASSDPEVVHRLVRVSSVGWVCLGPLSLHLFVELASRPLPAIRRLLPTLYGLSLLFFVIDLSTDWIHTGVRPAPWGWAYELGPTYFLFYAFTVSCLFGGMLIVAHEFRHAFSPAERSQARWLAVGVAVPLTLASVTDGILPALDVQVVRLGTISFSFLGATIAWSVYRYGYSLLAPGTFAAEILETLPDGVALLRPDGVVRAANGGLAALAGGEPGMLERTSVHDWIADVPLDPGRRLRDRECQLRTRTGAVVPVAVTTSTLCDRQREAIGLVMVVRDLREVTALRRRLVTSGRLAAVGQLAAGIAHEINNPIAFVRSNLGSLGEIVERARHKLAPPASEEHERLCEAAELVEESLDGVDRVAAIVRDVKGFSRAGGEERQSVDLNELLDRVLRVATPQLRPCTRVERAFDDVPLVPAAEQELQQVFLNLVVNASQAVGERGRIRVLTRRESEGVAVWVEDDGCGIAPEVIDRIFDPFFTTKPVGEGTGLGLSISYQIVRHHGGELAVTSEPGGGARFRVWLPTS